DPPPPCHPPPELLAAACLHLPNLNYPTRRRKPHRDRRAGLVQPIAVYPVGSSAHYIAGSDTSQIPSDVFFSYNNGVFTLHSVYFSVTFTKSKQKKVKQTTFMYKSDHLRSLVRRHLFFFYALQHPQLPENHQ